MGWGHDEGGEPVFVPEARPGAGSDGLTEEERTFVAAYDGDVKRTAEACGITPKRARALMRLPHLRSMLRHREQQEVRDLVADRKARQEFWTAVMNDPEARMADRLKASELLGRSEADFVDRVETTQTLTLEVLLAQAGQLDVIDAPKIAALPEDADDL